jgi:hypothetical protein
VYVLHIWLDGSPSNYSSESIFDNIWLPIENQVFGIDLVFTALLFLDFGPIFFIWKLEGKLEGSSLFRYRFEAYGAVKHTHNILRNDQSKANSMLILGSCLFHKSKQLEQLILWFIRNTDACIANFHFQELLHVLTNFCFYYSWFYYNFTFFGELNGIWL